MGNIQEKDFKKFAEYIQLHYGIHFKQEKQTLVESRLGQILAEMKFNSLTDYLNFVIADKTGKAASVMLDRLTTNYTYFMREPEHFYFLRDRVLPYLEKTVKEKDLRIWSAACSSGEEPYTIAMMIDEFFSLNKENWDTKVLATDISDSMLRTAKDGIYTNDKISQLPDSWKKRYLKKIDNDRSMISEKIKNEVVFNNFNLMSQTFPFRRKMHVIFCRNVMIYFDNETKDRLIEKFYDITEPGGFLFIGLSEGLNRDKTRYKYVMPAVYLKE